MVGTMMIVPIRGALDGKEASEITSELFPATGKRLRAVVSFEDGEELEVELCALGQDDSMSAQNLLIKQEQAGLKAVMKKTYAKLLTGRIREAMDGLTPFL